MTTKRWLEVQFQKEGLHTYLAAATDSTLATNDEYDVSFLGNEHFHYFFFTVKIEVFHVARDIEFIQLRRWLENQYTGNTLQLNNKSCEMICDELQAVIAAKYPGRDMVISVAEDNINKTICEYSK